MTTMILATLVALVVLTVVYRPYVRAIHGAAHRIGRDRTSLAGFIVGIVALPLALTLI